MSESRYHVILLAGHLGLSVAFPVVTGLVLYAFKFAAPGAMFWIAISVMLAVMVTNAVSLGRFIARWRARRGKVPDGPEADYVDPVA